MYKFDDSFKNGRISFGHDAVAKIEDVSWMSSVAPQDIASRVGDNIPWCKDERGIEISLKCNC